MSLLLPARLIAADLVLLGTHPTSPLTSLPRIHTLKAFEGRIYFGYGEWQGANFPAVVVASFDPASNAFHLEFSANTDSIGIFREIGGVLYVPHIDPVLYADSRDYSYRAGGVWRDSSPRGMLHVFDMATLDGSDLWLVGAKNPNETAPTGPAVFRSADGGRSWQDLTIQSALTGDDARYYWGFPLRGRFYVRDTYYEGTNGTRTANAPYRHFNRATPMGTGANEFIVGVTGWVSGSGGPLTRLLVTYDTQTWRTLRGGNIVFHFTVSGSNIFTLETNVLANANALWMASAVTPSSAVWQKLNFNNVPANAKAIEVLDGVIYVADTQGGLWAGRLDGGPIAPPTTTVVNELADDFGRALSFDGDVLAVGSPDYSGAAPLCGQVTIWEASGEVSGAWMQTATIDPPSPSFSGWFGKNLAVKDDMLAVIEAGRDLSRTDRGSSAQVHFYERTGQNWTWRQTLDHPQAQSVAIDSGWLAVSASNSLSLYSIVRSPSTLDVTLRTNFIVAPSYFNDFQALSRVALDSNLCTFAVIADVGGNGGAGEVRIYQRDAQGLWSPQQVLRSDSPTPTGLSFQGPWMYDAVSGVWHADGQQAALGSPMTSRLNSPPITVSQAGAMQLSFLHRWSFEPGFDGGQLRISINGGPYNTVPTTAFTQNGYSGVVLVNSASELHGQDAFINESIGHGSGTRVTSVCNLGFMNAGDSISIQFFYGGDNNTRGNVPNWEIDSVSWTLAGSPLQSDDFNSSDGGYTVETQPALPPDRFGFSLALHNGWLAVGAPRDDTVSLQGGAVHLYERTNGPGGASFVLRQSIPSPVVQPEAAFGNSVALRNSTLLVGSPGVELNGQRHHGAVFVFRRETNTWRNVAEVIRPPGSDGEFGTMVAFGSKWLAASSRFSHSSSDFADRVAIWRFGPPAGELSAPRRLNNGNFEATATGELGRTYYLQAATDLLTRNWMDLFSFTLTMPTTNLLDTTTATVPQKFYRLMSHTDAAVP